VNKVNTNKKKVTKRKSRPETNTNGQSKEKYSLQELEDITTIQIEELLQSIQALEDSFQDLPSIDDYLADVKQLTDQIEKDLEEYLYG
jgi:vacuolar-type H+-ATPase subunit I/STV1